MIWKELSIDSQTNFEQNLAHDYNSEAINFKDFQIRNKSRVNKIIFSQNLKQTEFKRILGVFEVLLL